MFYNIALQHNAILRYLSLYYIDKGDSIGNKNIPNASVFLFSTTYNPRHISDRETKTVFFFNTSFYSRNYFLEVHSAFSNQKREAMYQSQLPFYFFDLKILSSQSQILDDCAVSFDILLNQVIEQAATLANQDFQ